MKLLLFLGAGVSVPSGLPTAPVLTQELYRPVRDDDDAIAQIQGLLKAIEEYDIADIARVGLYPRAGGFSASGAIYRSGGTTYEDLFFLCQQISLWNIGLSDNSLTTPFMERIQEKARGLLGGSTFEARMSELARLGRHACSYIESVVVRTLERQYVKGFDLIREMAQAPEVEQLNIVTLNHDTLVEQFLIANDLEFVDGFGERDGDVRWSDDKVYENPDVRMRVFKLHGSVNWYSFRHSGKLRPGIFVGTDLASARDRAGQILRREYLNPSFLSGISKADAYQRGIYADIHFHFYEMLRQCDRIVMSGYGWGDTGINFRLDTWLDRSRGNKIILLQENPEALMNKSLIFASGYNGWSQSGQLVCVENWLCNTSLFELRDHLFKAQ